MSSVATDVTRRDDRRSSAASFANSCVNEGTPESGHEIRSVRPLESYLRPVPGVRDEAVRASFPGRSEALVPALRQRPEGALLHLMGTTPTFRAGLTRRRLAARSIRRELIDRRGVGRGEVDMLDVTRRRILAVAVRRPLSPASVPKIALEEVELSDLPREPGHSPRACPSVHRRSCG